MSCSAVYLSAQCRAVLLGATRQLIGASWAGASGFTYSGSIGPLPLSASLRTQLERLGQTLAENFDLVGLWGVDYVGIDDEAWPVEVNPRWPASVEVLERALDLSAISLHRAACRESQLPSSLEEPQRIVAGKAIVFARQTVSIGERFTSYCQEPGDVDGWPRIADIPPPGTTIESGKPIVTVFARGENEAEVHQRLREAAERVYGTMNS